jgi:hypothetical protein
MKILKPFVLIYPPLRISTISDPIMRCSARIILSHQIFLVYIVLTYSSGAYITIKMGVVGCMLGTGLKFELSPIGDAMKKLGR